MQLGNTPYKPNLLLNNHKLAVVDEVKDLGVAINCRLTFDVHVHQIVAWAFVRANLIHNCFVSHDIFTLMRAVKVYDNRICVLCMVSVSCETSKAN